MKEFMLLIRNRGEHTDTQNPEEHKEFLQKCRDLITRLEKEGRLVAAQPLVREGMIISKDGGTWKETAFDKTKEVQVGYYHILANDLQEAIDIAKANPEFEYGTTASIEVRPVKMKEEKTGYVYPNAN